MTALTYRLSSGETWTLAPSPEGVEIVGELAPDGLHVILTRGDARRLADALYLAVWAIEDAERRKAG